MTIAIVVGKSLYAAAGMFWSMFWALVLGFTLSGAIQAFVPKKKMVRVLGKPGIKELGLATFFGAVSSSCSYAATSMARSLFQKGAHIIPALAFMIASTNLVIELSIVLWAMMGWQFVLAEFVGGFILIAIMAGLMRALAPIHLFKRDGKQNGNDDEVVADPRTLDGWRAAARAAVMEWQMIWKDIVLGVVISGFIMVLVPHSFWQSLFMQGNVIVNAFVGPLIAVFSFVCSVGNIPLAGVLYHNGISFGGVISFIYADLIIIPLILIYRKYYGWKLALWITGVFYVAMGLTGVIVDFIFERSGLVPHHTPTMNMMDEMQFFKNNYTFWLNLVFLALAIIIVRFAKSGKKDAKAHCCH